MIDREAARAGLDRAAAQRSEGRIIRALRDPLAPLRKRFLQMTGRTREVEVRTFWGGRFTGVLPEHVSTVIARWGFTDEGVCRALLDRLEPGGTMVDIGAHFGFFSLLGSALAGPEGRVVSIEAMPTAQARLKLNVVRNAAHPNVTVLCCAAFSEETTLEFRDFGLVNSSLNTAFAPRGEVDAGQAVEVQARPVDAILDDLGIGRVSVVKIDAESSELHVLEGMTGLIDRARPAMTVETAAMTEEQRRHSEAVDGWIAARGYRAWRYAGGRLVEAGPIAEIAYDNLLYLPED